jgi:transcriptional regulator with XRE-family HTH domain
MDALGKIKRMQKEKGWSGNLLAKKSGLTPSTISMMFIRNNQPTIPTLEAICGAFGITLSQFFADNDMPPGLSPDQKNLLEHWNRLGDDHKEVILMLIKRV